MLQWLGFVFPLQGTGWEGAVHMKVVLIDHWKVFHFKRFIRLLPTTAIVNWGNRINFFRSRWLSTLLLLIYFYPYLTEATNQQFPRFRRATAGGGGDDDSETHNERNEMGRSILIGGRHVVICVSIRSPEFLRELQMLSYEARTFIWIYWMRLWMTYAVATLRLLPLPYYDRPGADDLALIDWRIFSRCSD